MSAGRSQGTDKELVRLVSRIHAYAAKSVGEAAADVAQEAIARTLTALEEGKEIHSGRLSGYAFGIARNLMADFWRNHGRCTALEDDPVDDDQTETLECLVHREAVTGLWAAIGRLSTTDRDTLMALFFEGLSSRELAKRNLEPEARVRQRKCRALARLREHMIA